MLPRRGNGQRCTAVGSRPSHGAGRPPAGAPRRYRQLACGTRRRVSGRSRTPPSALRADVFRPARHTATGPVDAHPAERAVARVDPGMAGATGTGFRRPRTGEVRRRTRGGIVRPSADRRLPPYAGLAGTAARAAARAEQDVFDTGCSRVDRLVAAVRHEPSTTSHRGVEATTQLRRARGRACRGCRRDRAAAISGAWPALYCTTC